VVGAVYALSGGVQGWAVKAAAPSWWRSTSAPACQFPTVGEPSGRAAALCGL